MITFIEAFWKSFSKRTLAKSNSRDFISSKYNIFNGIFYKSKLDSFNYGGISKVALREPVELESGVQFSYTALNPFGKSVNGKEPLGIRLKKIEKWRN